MAYDARGQVSWAMRQMAMLENGPALTITNNNPGPGLPPVTAEGVVVPVPRAYDVAHTYQRTAAYDHGGRPTSMVLPTDPDWTGGGAAPVIGGVVAYDARGLPNVVTLTMDAASRPIVSDIRYTEHGLVSEVVYGDTTGPAGASRDATTSTTRYDACLRPRAFRTERDATSGTGRDLGLVTTPMHQQLVWDEANNLVRVEDLRIAEEWPDSFRPQSVDIWHDALYRVVDAEYTYHQDAHTTGADVARDWRTDFATSSAADPMRPTPAAMAAALPAERVNTLRWRYDWLGNMQDWTDDASSFYERSIGDIENGADRATHVRPGALHFASNIQKSASAINVAVDRGGWVEATYGENGNVVTMTVHAQCFDQPATSCWDDATLEGPARATHLRAACACAEEQHYQYRWDELNRLHQARRFDRVSGAWTHAVTQRYRYDSANQRTIKSAEAIRPRGPPGGPGGPPAMEPERIALYIYPGDYERRGLERHPSGTYNASTVLETETQYLVGGARVVWKHNTPGTVLDRDQRVTVALTDILQTSSAVVDLESGELLEASTYYPNGARESYRPQTITAVAAEPMGFTGKEADDEVGMTYFGERYLIPRLGRWASPDPLQVHAAGGGEPGNSYHYVGGDALQSRDPTGLQAGARRPPRYARNRGALSRSPLRNVPTESHNIPTEYSVYRDFYERLPPHLREALHPPESFLRQNLHESGRNYTHYDWTGIPQGPQVSGRQSSPSHTQAEAEMANPRSLARLSERFARLIERSPLVRRAIQRYDPTGAGDWSHPLGTVAQRLQELLGRQGRHQTAGASVEFTRAENGQIEAHIYAARNGSRELTRGQREFLNETFGTEGWTELRGAGHAEEILSGHARESGAEFTYFAAGNFVCGACRQVTMEEGVVVTPLRESEQDARNE